MDLKVSFCNKTFFNNFNTFFCRLQKLKKKSEKILDIVLSFNEKFWLILIADVVPYAVTTAVLILWS